MASSEEDGTTQPDKPVVPSSTYDLLAERLGAIAQRLTDSATILNTERAGVFAAVPLELAEQDRLHTEQPSVPRDAVCVGDLLVFGYNPSGGLGRNRRAEDVFALFRVNQAAASDWDFSPLPIDDPDWFLADSSFQRDVGELFTYYADSRLLGLQLRDDLLLMIFAVGPSEHDRRVLRWRVTARQTGVHRCLRRPRSGGD